MTITHVILRKYTPGRLYAIIQNFLELSRRFLHQLLATPRYKRTKEHKRTIGRGLQFTYISSDEMTITHVILRKYTPGRLYAIIQNFLEGFYSNF